jgi:hypothetical protein
MARDCHFRWQWAVQACTPYECMLPARDRWPSDQLKNLRTTEQGNQAAPPDNERRAGTNPAIYLTVHSPWGMQCKQSALSYVSTYRT